ncbi:EXS-domain-containing protein [Coprinopsis marcescibilis]|uniref:EXS-domain-containing protein n=1 Tax=Coprinopsis marcescibilis TaxID=230819 RepID=A0A5C3KI27_COPMA|nr:EXS-domain-containing protein [Coprinopsis marcescibilis]
MLLGGIPAVPPLPYAVKASNPLSLHDLMSHLSPHEVAFFVLLDAQLDKVESFYTAREKEMAARSKSLEEQLRELEEHKRLFLVRATLHSKTGSLALPTLMPPFPIDNGQHDRGSESGIRFADEQNGNLSMGLDRSSPPRSPASPAFAPDADNYLYAKRKLKKAAIEHYRGLELLHNYRVLNLTGFRKALKKFEKVTKIPVQDQYMSEKVEKSALASDKVLQKMIREMEEMYAMTFVHGNKKKALKRLRGGTRVKSHHFSTFRSGLMLGLAVPAYWLARVVGKLFLSGTRRVEFTDFWLGDQFCSLMFTLSNIYFVGCAYADGFSSDWRKCGSASNLWPVAYVLAVLPYFIRLVQSVKRYSDSGLVTHLINAGKYGSGMVSYLLYSLWRHQGKGFSNRHCVLPFTLYDRRSKIRCIIRAVDFLMDWSVLRVRSPNFLLRQDLVYSDHISFYYFAIVSNVILRFSWLLFIPAAGPDMQLRSFVVGLLEMLRRVQWNFYRLENEHLGNMDQYRVTREVPLPYLFDDPHREDDGDEEETRKR